MPDSSAVSAVSSAAAMSAAAVAAAVVSAVASSSAMPAAAVVSSAKAMSADTPTMSCGSAANRAVGSRDELTKVKTKIAAIMRAKNLRFVVLVVLVVLVASVVFNASAPFCCFSVDIASPDIASPSPLILLLHYNVSPYNVAIMLRY